MEGSLIEFYIVGPMHWLGSGGYRRGCAAADRLRGAPSWGLSEWPQLQEKTTRIEVRQDGQLLASRRVNRFERFQLARFARCAGAADPYVYALDAPGIQRAACTGHHDPAYKRLHQHGSWRASPCRCPSSSCCAIGRTAPRPTVSFEALTVLRANSGRHAGEDLRHSRPAALSGRAPGTDGLRRARGPMGKRC